ncbi:putative LRR receptor-like serine/threonine-protein kinase At1g51880 [Tasmannia lanceolata]|uniref:putative LRR receptor-like serine/threonine-protein kinase At1g51880 n=1 Tax=Tasmannia lanceolata TaxID=3420 RepID=UPI004063FA6D
MEISCTLCKCEENSSVRLDGKMVSLLLLLVLFAYPDFYDSVNIDCGAESSYLDFSTIIEWSTDHDFIDTGHNGQVLRGTPFWTKQMSSLRFFSDQNKNCYTLPATIQEKYLIRAGFYYGNYDRRSKPPIFDLQLDGNFWATVNSSLDRPLLYEAIIVSRRDNISVCVARTRDGELPFISTLEMIPIPSEMYGEMDSNRALFNKYRVDFGGSEATGYLTDTHRRIWYPVYSTRYPTVIADYIFPTNSLDDDPPFTVVKTAIEAPAPSDSIILMFNLDQPQIKQSKYVNLYFTEVKELDLNQTRTFDVYMDGENYNLTVSPRYEMYDEISGNTNTTVGSFVLTLAPTQNSTLPPIISAMELFIVSDDLVEGTMDDDVRGLEELGYNSERISRWTGDPCLPANTVWEWLRCNSDDPPRVTALYLSGYELQGSLRDFSQMQALEFVDLQNNSLTGPIPDFLGKLPNLKDLNLAYNRFTGSLPESLINNNKISINVTGNPGLEHGLEHPEKNKIPLIVGLSVTGVLLFVIFCLLLVILLHYSRKRREKEETTLEFGSVQEDSHVDDVVNVGLDQNGLGQNEEIQEETTAEFGGLPMDAQDGNPKGDNEVNVGVEQNEDMLEELRKQMESELGELVELHGQLGNEMPH